MIMLGGCMGGNRRDLVASGVTWNVPEKGNFEFDNSKYIKMKNMACQEIGLEFYQDEKKAQDGNVLVNAGILNNWENISDKNSLSINIDGQIESFDAADYITEHQQQQFSYGIGVGERKFSNRKFILPEKTVRNAAAAKNFMLDYT